MRVLSPAERAHQTDFKELHLTPQLEDEHFRALDEYAAYNFISLPAVSISYSPLVILPLFHVLPKLLHAVTDPFL